LEATFGPFFDSPEGPYTTRETQIEIGLRRDKENDAENGFLGAGSAHAARAAVVGGILIDARRTPVAAEEITCDL